MYVKNNYMKWLLVTIAFFCYALVSAYAECQDSTTRFETTTGGGKNISRTCKWVQRKPTTSRCNLPNVKESCPRTCGLCLPMPSSIPSSEPSAVPSSAPSTSKPTLCQESTTRFETTTGGGTNKSRTCKWVQRKPTTSRCNLPNVKKSCPKTCGLCTVHQQSKPNILLVLADDVGTGDVPGYWGTGKVSMPNLEQLVNDGVVFTDAHSTPLCAPSRYVLLSGNYAHRGTHYAGTWRLNYESSQFRDGQQSIADVLKANGYHTAMMGKWHLGGKVPTQPWFDSGDSGNTKNSDILTNDKHDWSQPIGFGPQDLGFDSSYMTVGGIQAPPYTFVRDGFIQSMANITTWKNGTYDMPYGLSEISKGGEGIVSWDSTAYNMILVNETERFLDDHMKRRNGDPFFAYIALGNVHNPHSPPRSYIDGTPVAGEYPTPHMDVLLEMDKVMGSLTALLRDRNIEDDIMIVFASDNGGLGPEDSDSYNYGHNSHGPLRGIKGQIWEGEHRIPLIMKWKNGNVPSGESRSKLVGLNDIYATLCDLAGVEVPLGQAIDSISFAKYLQNETEQSNMREYLGVWRVSKKVQYESIRKHNLKLIRNVSNDTLSLYNLDDDLSESNSLISQQIYAGVVAEMLDKLEEIGPCYDNQGSFLVDGENSTCQWFAERSHERCNDHPEGKVECRLTCAPNSFVCSPY